MKDLKMERCPRCGERTMREPKEMNALSRFRDEYICSDCGVGEALAVYYLGADNYEWWIDEE